MPSPGKNIFKLLKERLFLGGMLVQKVTVMNPLIENAEIYAVNTPTKAMKKWRWIAYFLHSSRRRKWHHFNIEKLLRKIYQSKIDEELSLIEKIRWNCN